jgi:hypothetical protein
MIHDPLPWCGPAIPAEHRQGHPQFINEFQAVDVERLDSLTERGTECLDALGIPLRGVERLFFTAVAGAVRCGKWSLG